VGVAVEISLLSCIEAEILRYFISTSGYGGHLGFKTTPTAHSIDIGPIVFLDLDNVDVAV